MSDILLIFGFFLLGAIWGSFGNVVIIRLPKGESVVTPSSACRRCEKKIKWYDNIPILSWIILRGQCRSCGEKISARYPLVEFITAVLFALCFIQFGLTWTLLEVLILVFGLVVISFIDLDLMIIPNKISYPGIIIGLIGALANPEREWWDGFAGLLMGGGFFWAVAFVYSIVRKRDGLGGGDIKLMAWIGAVLGWKAIPFVIFSSSLIGSFVGIFMIIRSKGNMQTSLPFGPYIAFGAILYLVANGQRFTEWYFGIHGL